MDYKFSKGVSSLQPSVIREILKTSAGSIPLAAGNPAPDAFPVDDVKKILGDVMQNEPILALQYGISEGYAPLIKELTKLAKERYGAMGEDVYSVIRHFAAQNKLFFVHFRDVAGCRTEFHECFHDDGATDMARAIRVYRECSFHGPIRVDHVPTMAGENADIPGYANMGRLYAIGYLKGLLEASGYPFE